MTPPRSRPLKSASVRRWAPIATLVAAALVGALAVAPTTAGPEVEIRATGLSGGAPFTVYFAAKGARRAATVDWDFGDGGTSHDPGTHHTFVEQGLYEVRLRIEFPDGSVAASSIQVLAHSGG